MPNYRLRNDIDSYARTNLKLESMKKRHEVHRLPTEGKSILYKLNSKDTLHIGEYDFCKDDGLRTNQHLYFTNDEEIKEGDHVLLDYPRGKEVAQMIENVAFRNAECINSEKKHDGCNHRKITVSTDPKLTNSAKVSAKDGAGIHIAWIPSNRNIVHQPSQDFIEAYCEQGGIDEVWVEVEYIRKGIECMKFEIKEQASECKHICTSCFHSRGVATGYKLKLNPDNNTVITHLIKQLNYSMEFIKWYSGMDEEKILRAHERWIKESKS